MGGETSGGEAGKTQECRPGSVEKLRMQGEFLGSKLGLQKAYCRYWDVKRSPKIDGGEQTWGNIGRSREKQKIGGKQACWELSGYITAVNDLKSQWLKATKVFLAYTIYPL